LACPDWPREPEQVGSPPASIECPSTARLESPHLALPVRGQTKPSLGQLGFRLSFCRYDPWLSRSHSAFGERSSPNFDLRSPSETIYRDPKSERGQCLFRQIFSHLECGGGGWRAISVRERCLFLFTPIPRHTKHRRSYTISFPQF